MADPDALPVFGPPDSTPKPKPLSRTYSQSDLSPGDATSDAFPSSPPSPSPGVREPTPVARLPKKLPLRSSMKAAAPTSSSASSSAVGSVTWAVSTYHVAKPSTPPKDEEADGDSSCDEFSADSPDSPEHDNDDDPDYVEPTVRRPRTQLGPVQRQPKPSPAARERRKTSVATTVKNRVKRADPNGAMCLLTNAARPTRGLQFVHVLARATDDATLKGIEWWWQMPYFTLYIDTHYNIFVLQSSFHHPMDGGDWALVPHHKLITSLLEWTKKVASQDRTGFNPTNRVPISELYENQKDFGYYFLALTENMKETVIYRYSDKADLQLKNFTSLTAKGYSHPTFSTQIGQLISHIRPNFVVFAAGQKLAEIRYAMNSLYAFSEFLARLAETACFGHESQESMTADNLRSLGNILAIYDKWTSTKYVPKSTDTGRSARWLYHPDAPECKDLEAPEGWPTL
ncbi:hypothetical protein C8R47DRAFT_1165170 [Mycena vitilis]|nr:hypothetical protein C8R47DRAFT_1165170 [Mycena vitilis]